MAKQIANGEFNMRRSFSDYRTLFSPISIILPDSGFILDSGCGMGYACRELEHRDPQKLCVIGITITRTPTVYPVIYYNMEEPLTKRLKYKINLCLDIYGAISYSCYPVKVIQNILDVTSEYGSIYIFCSFMGRLEDIHKLLHKVNNLIISYVDECRMVLIKGSINVKIPEKVQQHLFYAGKMAVTEPV